MLIVKTISNGCLKTHFVLPCRSISTRQMQAEEKGEIKKKSLGFRVSRCWLDAPRTRRMTTFLNVRDIKINLKYNPKNI